MKNNNNKSEFFECACSGHAMNVMKFENEEEVYISIWKRGTVDNMSMWQKLRNCWKVLRDGTPYEDEVVLNKETQTKLVKMLNSILKEEVKAKKSK